MITGAFGQIGTELTIKCRKVYGNENIIAADIIQKEDSPAFSDGPFELLDVLKFESIQEIASKYRINYIIHLASMLSASGEDNPHKLWRLNMGGLYNTLEIAREFKCGFFTPSSIASFGKDTPFDNTPQDTLQRPQTIYGISKVAGELLCDYYFNKYKVDTRGLRFPGLISYKAFPGGGTTDYAVEIFYKALTEKKYTFPLSKNTFLDMMYMEDAIDSVIQLIEADPHKLKHRNAFNVSGMSFCPEDLAKEIRKHIKDFTWKYEVNPALQAIANSWPNSMDTSAAAEEWGFSPKFNLSLMVKEMINNLKMQLKI